MPEFVTVYTTAPQAYDYDYVEVLNPEYGTTYRGETIREVRMPVERREYQTGRYRSGWHIACDETALELYT